MIWSGSPTVWRPMLSFPPRCGSDVMQTPGPNWLNLTGWPVCEHVGGSSEVLGDLLEQQRSRDNLPECPWDMELLFGEVGGVVLAAVNEDVLLVHG